MIFQSVFWVRKAIEYINGWISELEEKQKMRMTSSLVAWAIQLIAVTASWMEDIGRKDELTKKGESSAMVLRCQRQLFIIPLDQNGGVGQESKRVLGILHSAKACPAYNLKSFKVPVFVFCVFLSQLIIGPNVSWLPFSWPRTDPVSTMCKWFPEGKPLSMQEEGKVWF